MFCDVETWTGLNINEIGCISYCRIIDRVDVVGCAEKEVGIVLSREIGIKKPTSSIVEIDARIGIHVPLTVERIAHVEIEVAELGVIF